jgi:hypothetical protein
MGRARAAATAALDREGEVVDRHSTAARGVLDRGADGAALVSQPDHARRIRRIVSEAVLQVQAKVGELTMKLEIVEWFLEKKGYGEAPGCHGRAAR